MDTMNVNISQYIIPYLKQIKCSKEFIVGVSIVAISAFIKCPRGMISNIVFLLLVYYKQLIILYIMIMAGFSIFLR